MQIITDFLDVTFSPDNTPFMDLELVLQGCLGEVLSRDDGDSVWRLGEGIVKLDVKHTYARASASGAALSELRLRGAFDDYLSAVSTVPHTITRLDAALDVYTDFPEILRTLDSKFPSGRVPLSRKGLSVTTLLKRRSGDSLETGTWYAGHRSHAKVTAKVYDKAEERRARKVQEGTFPDAWTRYEFTFRREVGCTLRDAHDPTTLFWSVAPILGLEKPKNVLDWSSGCLGAWSYTAPERLAADKVRLMVQESVALKSIFDAAEKANCSDWVLKLLQREHSKRFGATSENVDDGGFVPSANSA